MSGDISNKCTVLVNSCDKYEEAWMPFIFFFKKEWPDCPFPLAINTETKHCKVDGVITYNSNSENWGGRLYDVLQQIETPFVICLLEDFFLRKQVDKDEIYTCIDRMEQDKDIAAFYYNRIGGYTKPSEKYERYFKMEKYTSNPIYYFNCQAALWRKDVLCEVVKKCRTPWELEMEGYAMAPENVRQMKYYCLKNACHDKVREDDVFSYLLRRSTGYGIYGSKWLWNNKKFFKNNGVNCNCSTLPTMTKIDYYWPIYKQKIIKPFYVVYTWLRKK